MLAFICLIVGIVIGYFLGGSKPSRNSPSTPPKTIRRFQAPTTLQQKIYLKSYHQTDSDRIRELNLLSTNQSVFLRLLKQTFSQNEIAIKQNRFIVLDRDKMPFMIFEYRDGTQPMKVIDKEDGIPLHLYKGLISSEEIQHDYLSIKSQRNSA